MDDYLGDGILQLKKPAISQIVRDPAGENSAHDRERRYDTVLDLNLAEEGENEGLAAEPLDKAIGVRRHLEKICAGLLQVIADDEVDLVGVALKDNEIRSLEP